MRAVSSRQGPQAFREQSILRRMVWMLWLFGMASRAWSAVHEAATAHSSGWGLATACAAGALAGLIYSICRRYLFRYLHKRTVTALEAPSAEARAQISIYREGAYVDKLRAYTVLFDGKAVGEILPEESRTFAVSEGRHVVTIKIDWAESNSLAIDASQQSPQRLKVRSNLVGLRAFLAPWYAIFLRKSYLRLEFH